mmetsp:Transcript_43862/g.113271  ORF Transcript_43862/g.113271 Transcript_43862/m.113271 type:complete len:494 (-) Transcript_43862:114-1595(-)
MSWDSRLYSWVRDKYYHGWWRGKPREEDSWFYGDEIEECVGSVFNRQSFPDADEESLEARRHKWASFLQHNQKYGSYSSGNRVTALEGGDASYTEMLAAIAAAQTRVWCESYIFDNSRVAGIFVEALGDARRRGCDVILMVDYIGALPFKSEWADHLQSLGADVIFFNPVLPSSRSVGPISFRDHRKILICDEVGFCGSMNIQDEVGEAKFGSSRFYEVHAMLEGPCVVDLAEVFRDSLHESGTEVLREPIAAPAKLEPGVYVQILQSNVRQRRRHLQKVITRAIGEGDVSVCVATAYFFPPGFLRRALVEVPTRGASLSLLLSGSSDFFPLPGDLLAQTHFLRRFLRETRGHEDRVHVDLYQKGHMHAKFMTVDGVFSTVGSFNYDLYSARRNLEVCVAVFDPALARTLQAIHEGKARQSWRTSLEDWCYHQPLAQMVCAVAYGAIRLSGRNLFDGLDCFQRKWLIRKAALTYLLEEQAAQFVATSMMWGLE